MKNATTKHTPAPAVHSRKPRNRSHRERAKYLMELMQAGGSDSVSKGDEDQTDWVNVVRRLTGQPKPDRIHLRLLLISTVATPQWDPT